MIVLRGLGVGSMRLLLMFCRRMGGLGGVKDEMGGGGSWWVIGGGL